MLTAYYGKEPFDLRLTALRLLRNLHKILGITLAGTLLFGGGYYVKNVALGEDPVYTATSTYKLSYVTEPSQSGDYYINEMTWNTYVHSEEFLEKVGEHLQPDSGLVPSAEMIEAKLDSDVHVPSTVVSTGSESWTLLLARAVEETMTADFAQSNEQVASVRLIDPAVTAQEVYPDVRPVRAFVLSAVLSFFFAVTLFLLREIGSDDIWLPATLSARYGLPAVGTMHSRELESNLDYRFRGKQSVAVCAADERIDPAAVTAALKREWTPVPAPLSDPDACGVLRESEGVLLVVKAGIHAGKPLEYVLEYLRAQEIDVTAALLWDADERLIRAYYLLPDTTKKGQAAT